MSDIKQGLGTASQSIACSFTSLSNNAAQQSDAIDNSSNLFLDALVSFIIKSGSSGTSSTGYVDVYAYGTVDAGTTYTDGATGSDGSFSISASPNLRYVGSVNVIADSTTYHAGPFSIAAAFGGNMPAKWGIVVVNKTGHALDASIGSAEYQGVYATAA